MDVEHTASTAKALIPAAEVDGSDSILTQHGSAHDTGLNGDIKVCFLQDADGMLGQNAGKSNELGVPRAIEGAIRLVHAASNDLAILDEDAANRCLVTLECQLGLSRRLEVSEAQRGQRRRGQLTMFMASRMKRS